MANILVIDDDDAIRSVVSQMLEKDSHHVSVASNGELGLKVFKQNPPDIVITDIIMPGAEGFEVIKKMLQMVEDLPIVAMSGGGRHSSYIDNLKIAKALGAKAVLPKPFTRSELNEAILCAIS